MYILIDVLDRKINVMKTYGDNDLERAKQDLKNYLQDYAKHLNLTKKRDWDIEPNGMEGWAEEDVDIAIMQV